MTLRSTWRILWVFTVVVCAWFFTTYGRKATMLYGDAAGYYWYLPATFIYHNHDSLNKLPPEDQTISPAARYYAATMDGNDWRTPTGRLMVQYTYGVALMEAPFFFAALFIAHATGGNTNGFTPYYESAMKLATIIYAALTLLLIYRLLRKRYAPNVSATTIALLLVGTNLFWFSLRQAGMAHIPLAFLYALLMILTERITQRPKPALFAAMGGVVGLVVLIRPTEIICLLIPLLYGVWDKASAKARVRFLRQNAGGLLIAACAAAVPIIPQLLYWKYMAGSYLYYSYSGQQFFWTKPQIAAGLFSPRNGWLYYTPLMAAAIAGLLLWRRYRPWALVLFTLLPCYIWIVYAWYCANYINGFGSRPMIHLYPLLAFPLAAAVTWGAGQGKGWRMALALFAVLCIALNLRWSVLQALGLLKSEEANTPYNLSIFLQNRLTYEDLVIRDNGIFQPTPEKLQKIGMLRYHSFDDSLTDRYVPDTSERGTRVGHFYRMGEEEWLPDGVKINLLARIDSLKSARWVRVSGRFLCTQWPGYYKHHLFFIINRDRKEILTARCQIINKIGISDRSCPHADTLFTVDHEEVRRWGHVFFYVPLPKDLRDGDEIGFDIWNPGHQEILLDDLTLELYRPKN